MRLGLMGEIQAVLSKRHLLSGDIWGGTVRLTNVLCEMYLYKLRFRWMKIRLVLDGLIFVVSPLPFVSVTELA